MADRGKKDQVTMAMRKPRSNNRPPAKNGQLQTGTIERDEDGGERGTKPRFLDVRSEIVSSYIWAASEVHHVKRKLSHMLGPTWSKEDLELFYQAYRKFGKDWKKVAGGVQKRTMEMVEALYGMNKAYLSLPDGTASATGLIAMMTDHYNNRSDESEEQSSEENGTPDRARARAKSALVSTPSLGSSGYGGPSPAKKPRSATAGRPWGVGKRAPRNPTANTVDQKPEAKVVISTLRQDESSEEDDDLRKEAEVGALTLVTASQQVVLPAMSRSTPRKYVRNSLHNGQTEEMSGPKMESPSKRSLSKSGDTAKERNPEKKGKRRRSSSGVANDTEFGGDGSKGHVSDNKSRWKKVTPKKAKIRKRVENMTEISSRDCQVGIIESESKDDEEDQRSPSTQKRKQQSLQRPKKLGRQLFSGDQSIGLDALATLAGLSLNGLLPSSTPCSGSASAFGSFDPLSTSSWTPDSEKDQDKPEELIDLATLKAAVERTNEIETSDRNNVDQDDEHTDKEENRVASGARPHSSSPADSRKRRRKAITEKTTPHVKKAPDEDEQTKLGPPDPPTRVDTPVVLKPRRKPKRLTTTKTVSKQGLKVYTVEDSPATDVEPSDQGVSYSDTADDGSAMSLKPRGKKKGIPEKGVANGSAETFATGIPQANCPHSSTDFGSLNTKARLIHCLSPKVQRWCMYEWFYSAIDLPWFANNEFVEYLHHAGLGHVPILTRVEWGVIRSSLGKPRRLSRTFLDEERKKLASYRESVRTHYQDHRNGLRDVLPSDLARPLTVGQRVIAKHPKTGQVHDGSVLTVDRSKCRVQFDRPELGVEFVKDIDAMPIYPMENMPEMMRRKRIVLDAAERPLDDLEFEPKPQALSVGGVARAALNERLERPGYTSASLMVPQYLLNYLIEAAQANIVENVVHAEAAIRETLAANRSALIAQQVVGESLGTENDMQALTKLSDLFSQKVPLVSDLRRLSDETEVCKSSETFQRQYSSVSSRLKEVNNQMTDVVKHLESQQKYQEKSLQLWARGITYSVLRNGESGSSLEGSPTGGNEGNRGMAATEVAASSRKHARAMVSAAMLSMSSLQEHEDPLIKLEGALDSIWKEIPPVRKTASSGAVSVQSLESAATVPSVDAEAQSLHVIANREPNKAVAAGRSFHADTASSYIEVPSKKDAAFDLISIGEKDSEAVTELMTSCVGALLMVQTLAEQRCPPAEIAQVISIAVESLRPQAAQNFCIFKDIEKQLSQIKCLTSDPVPIHSSVHQFPVETPIVQLHQT